MGGGGGGRGGGLLRINQYGDDLWQGDFEPNGANR